MFGLFQKKAVEYFSDQEKEAIVEAIRKAEQRTSGEIRIYIESKCSMVNPVHRAKELFLVCRWIKQQNAMPYYSMLP